MLNHFFRAARVKRPYTGFGRLVAVCALSSAAGAHATTVIGGSDLLSAASAQQLSDWLGEGPIQLTNIFDKVPGNTTQDFHAAADNKGATFSIIEVSGFQGVSLTTPILIGGYNPQSWISSGTTTNTGNSFIFNLSQSLLFTFIGSSEAVNVSSNGPSFGAGLDIGLVGSLDEGYSFLASYGLGGVSTPGRDISRYPENFQGTSSLTFRQIEVFAVSTVPEPESYLLMLAGLAAAYVLARRASRFDH